MGPTLSALAGAGDPRIIDTQAVSECYDGNKYYASPQLGKRAFSVQSSMALTEIRFAITSHHGSNRLPSL